MEKEIKELKLKQRGDGIYQVVECFPNGYGVSVLFGQSPFSTFFGMMNTYSNGKDNYEVAILKDGKICMDTPLTDDVFKYQTAEQVFEIIEKVKAL